jgi:hypothetical protein
VTADASPVADPSAVWRVIQGAGMYWALVVAVRLGLFDLLAGGSRSTDDVAAACGADAARLQPVLDALMLAGLVRRDGERWQLTAPSDAFLRTDRATSMAALVEWSPGWPVNWEHLADTVRGAPPVRPVDDDATFYGHLVDATFPPQLAAARRAVGALDVPGPSPHILDLGAGAAPWSIALLEAWPAARATVNDLPAVLDAARASTARLGVADRCDFVPGDYHEVPLETATYDLVVLGHIVRAEAPADAAALVARAADAVTAGGCVIVTEYVVDDDRAGPPNALMLGLTMVANTTGGRTYTRTELAGWLAAAGLGAVTSLPSIPPTDILLARPCVPASEEASP